MTKTAERAPLGPTTVAVDVDERSWPGTRVTLVRPPCVLLVKTLSGGGPIPPVGLAYVAAALLEAGHDVRVIDAAVEAVDELEEFETDLGTMRRVGLSPEQIVERIEPSTQMIGLSHMFLHEWPTVREIATLARERFPDAVIVVGGENATGFWPWMFEQSAALDVVVKGEGERTVVALADRVAAGQPYDDIQGLVSRPPDGPPVDNGLPARIRHLAEVSRPAWDLFPMAEYFEARSYFGVHRGRTMPMLATRGCPYECSFCSSPNMWTKRYSVRDPDDIADEIAGYVDRWGVENVDFVDLTAMTKRQWTLDFCDALERRGLDISWQLPVGTRSEGIDRHVLERLWATGCRNITFAPETGSARMLEVYDKRLDLDHVLADIRDAADLGMVVHVNTIIGHPAETPADRRANFRFLLKAALAGASTCNAAMFHPYPGSRDFQDLLEAGRVSMGEEFYYDGLAKTSAQTRSWNDGISSLRLFLTQLAMLLVANGVSLVVRPRRLVHLVRSLFGGHEHSFVEQQARVRLKRGPLRAVRAGSATTRSDAKVPA